MSEFRKYRLVTKLVDKYKVSWQPQRFLQYTVGPPPGGRDHQQVCVLACHGPDFFTRIG